MQGGVRSVEIVVMEVEREERGAVVRGVIRTSISPFAREGLDEAFGLAIGLRAVGFGEAMLEAQLAASLGVEFGTVGRAAVGEEALDEDAVSLVKGDGLVEGGENAGSFFIWKEAGESQA